MKEEHNNKENNLNPIKKVEKENNPPAINFDERGMRINYDEPAFREFLSYVYSRNSRQSDYILPHDYFILKKKDIINLKKTIQTNIYVRDKIDKPDSFIMRIYFEDGNKEDVYHLNQLEEYLVEYSEVTKIEINWIYYIKFVDRPYPEKQEIFLTIDTDIKKIKASNIFEDMEKIRIRPLYQPKSLIKITINHTEYSWATAIRNEIIRSLGNCVEDINGWRKLIHRYDTIIVLILLFIMFICVMVGFTNIIELNEEILINTLNEISLKQIDINDKLDLLIKFLIKDRIEANDISIDNINSNSRAGLAFILIGIISTFGITGLTALTLEKLLKPYDRSFILLSNGSTKSKARYYKENKNSWLHLIIGFIFSITASIIAANIDRILQLINIIPKIN